MENDQVEQLDACLFQSLNVLNKNQDTEETNASVTSKWKNRFPSPFDDQDTQTEIVMTEKRHTDLTLETKQTKVTEKKSIVASQKVAPANLTTTEEQLERWSVSPDQGA